MKIVDDFADVPAFDVLEPRVQLAPFVFNAPHSGTCYPRDLIARTRLDRRTLRRSEDTFVDELFGEVVSLGAPLMRANFPRVYVDVNRQQGELDPAMFDGPLVVPTNPDSPRVMGGLGVIARIVGERQNVYEGRLPAIEAERRIKSFYVPYHRRLAELVRTVEAQFGTCVLVDCHSMPSGAIRAPEVKGAERPDVILGDRFGTSCSTDLTEEFARLLRRQGFAVGRNRPYAGGFITEHHGRPPAIHAIQLEINRALYMDEASYSKAPTFDRLRADLTRVCHELVEWFAGRHLSDAWPMAAE